MRLLKIPENNVNIHGVSIFILWLYEVQIQNLCLKKARVLQERRKTREQQTPVLVEYALSSRGMKRSSAWKQPPYEL